MRMTRRKIEALLATLKDENEGFPLTRQVRDHLASTATRIDIPMRETWAAQEKLQLDECYCAIETLLRHLPAGTVL